jgi:hypothetical protein
LPLLQSLSYSVWRRFAPPELEFDHCYLDRFCVAKRLIWVWMNSFMWQLNLELIGLVL